MGRSDMQGTPWHYEYYDVVPKKKKQPERRDRRDCNWYCEGKCTRRTDEYCVGVSACMYYDTRSNGGAKKKKRYGSVRFYPTSESSTLKLKKKKKKKNPYNQKSTMPKKME